jgi:hypothetical protein
MAVSLVVLPVHSLQLNSDADLLRCFRSEEQRDSKLNFPFSVTIKKSASLIGGLIKLFTFSSLSPITAKDCSGGEAREECENKCQ